MGKRRRLTGQSTKGKTSEQAGLRGAVYPLSMALVLAATDVVNGTVLLLITVVVIPFAAFAFSGSGAAYRGLGSSGPFSIDQDLPERKPLELASPVTRVVQEAEARQMIEAKSYRRQQRGYGPLDVEAEVRRAMDLASPKPSMSEALRSEVRDLVLARNERRMRQGQDPLDVEVEVERQVEDFIGSP